MKEEVGNDASSTFNKKRAEGRDSKEKKSLQLKVRKLNPVNTLCYLQILGTGMDTQDTSPSVLLFFDNQRFIFNAGEGLQRFCTEHKIKLSKIDHIFLSRVCSETAGGLPGLLLTLEAIGKAGVAVNVWGPSDLKYLVNAMKRFISNDALVHTHSFGPNHSDGGRVPLKSANPIILVDDEVVRISAILLQPDYSKGPQHERVNGMHKPGDISVVYICELPKIKGKFDPAKAAALGLTPGPKYRDLQLGISVKSDRQDIMVHPSDVMDPSIPGPIVILVSCPSNSHLSELLAIESLAPFYTDSFDYSLEDAKTVNCVVHLTPSSISNNALYQKWMKRFGAAQHIIAGHKMKNVEIPILSASARITTRLNHLCPYVFPASGFGSSPDTSDVFLAPCEGNKYCASIPAENLLKFHLRPISQLGVDRSSVPILIEHSRIINELILEIPEVNDMAQKISRLWHDNGSPKDDIMSAIDNNVMNKEPWLNGNTLPACLENITREDMEIVLLGTGSSQPSKYRNVTAIFVNLFSKGSLLLDCGEGTLGQLKRRFGIQGADDMIIGLRCIWISHIHADHHTGLSGILALRKQLLQNVPHQPLLVIGPNQLKRYLDAYQRLEDLDMQFLDCSYTTEASLISLMEGFESSRNDAAMETPTQNADNSLLFEGSLNSLKEVLAESGIESLISVPVVHCKEAFGVVIKAADRTNSLGKLIPGWKLVYSGDTRPCEALEEAARGATVLIHEATFEDGLEKDARQKNHSTTSEAIKVGNDAGVYRIILTHFSQRYPKIPVFDEAHMHNTCIAFDMMSVNMADLPVLPKIMPYLKQLFKNELLIEDEPEEVENTVTAT